MTAIQDGSRPAILGFEDGTGPIVVGRMADRGRPGRHRKDVEPSLTGDLAILLAVYVVLPLLLALALGALS